jgi:transcriptional accessory protein Tex/SPT6
MPSDAREDRARLSHDVVDAVAKVYRAKAAYDSANQKRAQNIDALAVWRETIRRHLSNHGFVESEEESFAETMPRALGISTHELRNCIAENPVGAALLERFRGLENTADIATYQASGNFITRSR